MAKKGQSFNKYKLFQSTYNQKKTSFWSEPHFGHFNKKDF